MRLLRVHAGASLLAESFVHPPLAPSVAATGRAGIFAGVPLPGPVS
jgi:hypothetical protein